MEGPEQQASWSRRGVRGFDVFYRNLASLSDTRQLNQSYVEGIAKE